MSAPDATIAASITSGDEYFPVPTMSLERSFSPPSSKLSFSSSLT
jgi:hypothetical protein